MQCWLGVDCGSVSVKLALIDKNNKIVDDIYLRNTGLIETIKRGLQTLNNRDIEIKGVCCTGSGRYFAKLLLGGDIVKTEILAHTIATLDHFPNVRTIMDIGGEDCKIMEIRDGVLSNFIMNNLCGAGTGAVIETISARLGVQIKDFGELALQSTQRLDLPGKCGIFCQSAVVTKLNSGADKKDIMMGVARALVNNYLSLAKGISLRPPYVFQGATALNKSIKKALEDELGHEVIVPDKCAVMGAVGAAILSKEVEITNFAGFNIIEADYKTNNFKCKDCSNQCEVTQIYKDKNLAGSIGSRCGKWDKISRELVVET